MNAKRMMMMSAGLFAMSGALVFAGEASTSATAGSRGFGPGTAAATADYNGGGVGFTRTKANSGNVNLARGISFGVDPSGLSLSTSFAVAPRVGPAAAGTFNLSLSPTGDVSGSFGRSIASGDSTRTVSAGGSSGNSFFGSPARATTSGFTGSRGRVDASSHSFDRPSRSMRILRRR
jgi:hypothetical protein